jgi:hypothetical protein
VAFLYNPKTAPYAHYYLDSFRSAAAATAIEAVESPVHSAGEIEALITSLAVVQAREC